MTATLPASAVSRPEAAITHRLLLLRHAKAVASSSASGEAGDHARDLDERGRRDALALGQHMHRLQLKPDLVMTSSALRTRRSWELLNGFGDPAPTTEVMDRLYLAGPSELLAALHAASDAYGTLLLIGHNPGLHDLALHLAGSEAAAPERLRQGLPTCTLVAFSVGGSWRDLGPDSIHGTQMFAP